MTTKTGTRTIEVEIQIEASAEQVWKALTEAEELQRWFPLEARVTPGVGGEIFTGWGPGIQGSSKIVEWKPERRLRTTWFEQPAGTVAPTGSPLMVDYLLEAGGGTTTLRLVHSGFGADATWDEEFDGVRSGWAFELRSLRHYLEHHHGRTRRVAWARLPLTVPRVEAAQRLWSARGLLAGGPRPQGDDGDPYSLQLANGDTLEGRVLYDGPGANFGGTVDNMDRALFRAMIENCGQSTEAVLWLSSWTLPEARIRDIESRWTELLRSAGC